MSEYPTNTTGDAESNDAVENEYLENGTGFYPFSQIPVWIQLNASPNAVAVYAFLKTYAREDMPVAFPSRQTIASGALKTKQARSIDRYIAELEHIGAVVKKQRRSSGNLKIRNVYRLQWSPPNDFDAPTTRKQWEDMGCPVPETVPVFKNDGDKKPAYSVVRYSAHQVEQEKRPEVSSKESDITENTRSSRSAPQRTSMCATAHPGSAPQRTGSRSKPSISKPPPSSVPPNEPDAKSATPENPQGGETNSFENQAVKVWRDVLGLASSRLNNREKTELLRRLTKVLSLGCTTTVAVDRLTGVDKANSVFAAACKRLSGIEDDFDGQDPSDDPFVAGRPAEAPDGASGKKWCRQCLGLKNPFRECSPDTPGAHQRMDEGSRTMMWVINCPDCHPSEVSTTA